MFLHFAVLLLTSLTVDFLSRVFLGLCWTSSNHRLHISAFKSCVACAPSRLSWNSGMNLLSDPLTVRFIDSPASTCFIPEYVLSLYFSSSILSSAVSNLLQLSSEFFVLGYSIFQFHSLFFIYFAASVLFFIVSKSLPKLSCVIYFTMSIVNPIVLQSVSLTSVLKSLLVSFCSRLFLLVLAHSVLSLHVPHDFLFVCWTLDLNTTYSVEPWNDIIFLRPLFLFSRAESSCMR